MKILEGLIVSIGENSTAIVEVTRRVPHPLYRKLIKRSKRFTVDTNNFDLAIGNGVKITETRPMSKTKYFKVSEIVSKKETLKSIPVESEVEIEIPVKDSAKKDLKVEKKTEKPTKEKTKTTKKGKTNS